MMIAARNSFLMSGAKLPYDAKVEYIESTGTQYIDTGVAISSALAITIRLISTAKDRWGFGGRTANNVSQFGMVWQNDASGSQRIDWGSQKSPSLTAAPLNNIHTVSIINGVASVDGVAAHSFSAEAFSSTAHLMLCTYATSPTTVVAHTLVGRLYYAQIWDGANLVRDFTPVRVGSGSSAVGYLYDRVSGELFGNAADGGNGFPASCVGPDK